MANGFVVNANRFDPYKNFKFRVLLEGRIVMGVSKVGALKRSTEVVKGTVQGLPSTIGHAVTGLAARFAVPSARGQGQRE